MNILVINCGSSSFKYQLLDMSTETLLCAGLAERIGSSNSALTHKKYEKGVEEPKKISKETEFKDHTAALQAVLALMTDKEWGSVKSVEEIAAVGHRVVQGGELLQAACKVDDKVKKDIRDLAALAPLHNMAHLQGIDVAQALCPHAPSVVVFDTEFHATMPAKAYRYALPNELYDKYRIRRYGFHGTSHKYVTNKAAEFLGKKPEETNLITCHLGNGCSITAIENGKSVDTSMGFTPLAGTMMGTRCGDIDPAVTVFLGQNAQMSPQEIDNIMNKQSGLLGICGMNDMRDLHAARAAGNEQATLAFEMFSHSIKRYIGAYWAILGRVDAVVFTAGIGENDNDMRAKVMENMDFFGIKVDSKLNDQRSSEPRSISVAGTKTPVLVIPTNEELEIARTTVRVVSE